MSRGRSKGRAVLRMSDAGLVVHRNYTGYGGRNVPRVIRANM